MKQSDSYKDPRNKAYLGLHRCNSRSHSFRKKIHNSSLRQVPLEMSPFQTRWLELTAFPARQRDRDVLVALRRPIAISVRTRLGQSIQEPAYPPLFSGSIQVPFRGFLKGFITGHGTKIKPPSLVQETGGRPSLTHLHAANWILCHGHFLHVLNRTWCYAFYPFPTSPSSEERGEQFKTLLRQNVLICQCLTRSLSERTGTRPQRLLPLNLMHLPHKKKMHHRAEQY